MEIWWAMLASCVVLMILYGIVSSRLETRRKNKWRESKLPTVSDVLSGDRRYNVVLSDGRIYLRVRLAGMTDAPTGEEFLGQYGNMLVLEWPDGHRVLVRPRAVRCIEESTDPRDTPRLDGQPLARDA